MFCIHYRQILTKSNEEQSVNEIKPQDILADLLRNAVPDNIIEATFRKTQTKYKAVFVQNAGNFTNTSESDDYHVTRTMVKSVGKSDGPNILGLIVACMFIGIAAGKFRKKGRVFLDFFAVSADIVLLVFRWFLWLTPVGVASLTAASIAGTRDASGTFLSLGYFVLTVTLGILIIQFVCLPLIYYAFIRKNPYRYVITFKKAWLVGFASGSSALAMPDLLHACENINKIDKRIARFVIPLCCTMNGDGSALFISTAAMFIANITGYALTFGNVIIIGDRIRTGCNVESHTVCAAISYRFCNRRSAMTDGNAKDDVEENLTLVVSSKS